MATVRELVTQLRYALDRSGADDYVRAGTEAARKVQDASERAARSFRRLAGGVLAAFSARSLISIADTWSEMNDRVELATSSQEEAGAVMKELQEIARRSRAPLEQVSNAWLENVRTLQDMGVSTEDSLKFTEALNAALDLSAIRGQRAASVTMALSRAMDFGQLRGQNLNTIIMNGGMVAEALAKELGTTVSELSRLGSEGKITGDVIQRALVNRVEEFREEIGKGTVSLRDGIDNIRNGMLSFIGNADRASGVSERLGRILLWVGDNIGLLVGIAATIAGAFAFTKILGGLAAMREAILLIRSGWLATTAAAMAANWPIILIAAAVAGIAVAVQDIRTWLDGGDSVIGRWVGPSEEWREEIEGVARAVRRVRDAIKPITDFIGDVVVESGKVLSDFLGLEGSVEGVGDAIAVHFKGALRAVETILNVIASIIEGIVRNIQAAWDKAVAFKDFMKDNAVTRAFGSGLDYAGDVIDRLQSAETVNSPVSNVTNTYNVQQEINTSDPREAGREAIEVFEAGVTHRRFGAEAAP